jgi:hypothetical protein
MDRIAAEYGWPSTAGTIFRRATRQGQPGRDIEAAVHKAGGLSDLAFYRGEMLPE